MSNSKARGKELEASSRWGCNLGQFEHRHFFPRVVIVFRTNELPDTAGVSIEAKRMSNGERGLDHFISRVGGSRGLLVEMGWRVLREGSKCKRLASNEE